MYNIATALAAYPVGRLSDRLPRTHVLSFGCACLVLADLLLGFGPNLWVIFAGIAVWGVQIGITQSMFLALIADHVPHDLRGTGFGIFYLFSATAIFIAGIYGGYISENFNYSYMYIFSALIALLSILSLYLVNKFVFKKIRKN
jgi:MFS family permease